MAEWNMASGSMIIVKGFSGWYVPLGITFIPEKLSSLFNGCARSTKAVEAIRASMSKVRRCSNVPMRKDAKEVTA